MPDNRCSYCGCENAPHAYTCANCGREFRAQPEARSRVLRTFASQTDAQIVAKYLEDAEIPFVVTADDCGGMLPFLNLAGSIRLLVSEGDVPRAEAVLRQIEEETGVRSGRLGNDTGALADFPRLRRPQPHLVKLGLFLLGGLVGWMAYYAVTLQSAYSGAEETDWNGDRRSDAWNTWDHGQMTSSEMDRNFDGQRDSTVFYKDGLYYAAHEDDNFDGKTDVWYTYSNNITSRIQSDTDFDGRPDSDTRYKFGVPVETFWAISNQLGYWKRDFFTNGLLRQSDIDRNRDGVLDDRVFFDSYGVLLKSDRLN